MSEAKGENKKFGERALLFLRNINALGAVAIGAVGAVIDSGALLAYAAFNGVQAVFFEGWRRMVAKSTQKKIGKLAVAH
jgi:hypothetical protein